MRFRPADAKESGRFTKERERLNCKMEFGARPTTASAPTWNAEKDQAVRDSSHSKSSHDKFQMWAGMVLVRTSRTVRRLTEALTLPVPRGECGYWATPQPRHHAPSGDPRCLSKNFFSISSEAFAHLATQVGSDWHRIWCAIPPSGHEGSPEDLRSRERSNGKNGVRSQTNYRERS